MADILVVIKGGYGDAFPLFALSEELLRRGHQVKVAGESHHAAACASLGIPLISLEVARRSQDRTFNTRSRSALSNTLSPSDLADEVDILLPHARSTDLLIGNQLAYCGAMVRDLTHKPWVYCAASPLSLPSWQDPPHWPYARTMQASVAARRAVAVVARLATRAMMIGQTRLRHQLGLPFWAHPRFEGLYSRDLNLLMTSPHMAPPQPDWPAHTLVTGFAWFEPKFIGDGGQFEHLQTFAQDGERPVVFAPGGGLRARPEQFVENAIAATRRLGCRSIIVVGKAFHRENVDRSNVMFSGYFPYGALFSLARAVVHSAGIGTIGWSLRHALPSLLLPREWDQFDNAARAQRCGLAHVIDRTDLDADALALALQQLLADADLTQRLQRQKNAISQEHGAGVAADAVENLLTHPGADTPKPA